MWQVAGEYRREYRELQRSPAEADWLVHPNRAMRERIPAQETSVVITYVLTKNGSKGFPEGKRRKKMSSVEYHDSGYK